MPCQVCVHGKPAAAILIADDQRHLGAACKGVRAEQHIRSGIRPVFTGEACQPDASFPQQAAGYLDAVDRGD